MADEIMPGAAAVTPPDLHAHVLARAGEAERAARGASGDVRAMLSARRRIVGRHRPGPVRRYQPGGRPPVVMVSDCAGPHGRERERDWPCADYVDAAGDWLPG